MFLEDHAGINPDNFFDQRSSVEKTHFGGMKVMECKLGTPAQAAGSPGHC
jgi:hypothetical protein